MSDQQRSLKERDRVDNREPRLYEVIIYNDDFTTMDLVVKILREVFFLSHARASALMLEVHNSVKAVVGQYTYDIAVSKTNKAIRMARQEGFPLRLEIQPVE